MNPTSSSPPSPTVAPSSTVTLTPTPPLALRRPRRHPQQQLPARKRRRQSIDCSPTLSPPRCPSSSSSPSSSIPSIPSTPSTPPTNANNDDVIIIDDEDPTPPQQSFSNQTNTNATTTRTTAVRNGRRVSVIVVEDDSPVVSTTTNRNNDVVVLDDDVQINDQRGNNDGSNGQSSVQRLLAYENGNYNDSIVAVTQEERQQNENRADANTNKLPNLSSQAPETVTNANNIDDSRNDHDDDEIQAVVSTPPINNTLAPMRIGSILNVEPNAGGRNDYDSINNNNTHETTTRSPRNLQSSRREPIQRPYCTRNSTAARQQERTNTSELTTASQPQQEDGLQPSSSLEIIEPPRSSLTTSTRHNSCAPTRTADMAPSSHMLEPVSRNFAFPMFASRQGVPIDPTPPTVATETELPPASAPERAPEQPRAHPPPASPPLSISPSSVAVRQARAAARRALANFPALAQQDPPYHRQERLSHMANRHTSTSRPPTDASPHARHIHRPTGPRTAGSRDLHLSLLLGPTTASRSRSVQSTLVDLSSSPAAATTAAPGQLSSPALSRATGGMRATQALRRNMLHGGSSSTSSRTTRSQTRADGVAVVINTVNRQPGGAPTNPGHESVTDFFRNRFGSPPVFGHGHGAQRGHSLEINLTYEALVRLDEHVTRKKNQAKKSHIRALPTMKATKADTDLACCICLMDVKEGDNLKILPCCHKYHKDCIDEWLGHNGCCPLDKKRIDGSQ